MRANDGKLLWTYAIDAPRPSCPRPSSAATWSFFAAGYGRGGALPSRSPKAAASRSETVYPLQAALNNKHGGVVLVGDYLYGDTDDSGMPFCADLMTGEVKWKKRGSRQQSAAMAAADGHLYMRFANGTMVLAKATRAITRKSARSRFRTAAASRAGRTR